MGISKQDVERYLEEVKKAIRAGRYTVSVREKNEKLFTDFVFSEQDREDILLGLEAEDFCGIVNNEHPKFAHEKLYIFGKNVRLLPRFSGNERMVSLYIKFNQIENFYCIVVSFHEQEYQLKYIFK